MADLQNKVAYPQLNRQNYTPVQQPAGTQSAPVNGFNPSQLPNSGYYYPHVSSNPSTDINAVMRAQVMPVIKKGNGYIEMPTFDVPFLKTKGHLYKLDNGQGVIIVPKEGPTTIKTFAKVGSFNEKKHRGISHYIEHNLFNGSQGLAPNEFVEKVTAMGGIYNASTDTADTDYFIKSPLHKESDLQNFLTMHANMIHFPTFTEPMLEKEKGPVISEIQMYQDDPYDKGYNEMVKNLYGIKADYQGLIAGSSKIVQNLKREDVVNYYNEWYTPDNMLTVIVGDVDPDKTIELTSKLMNRKKAVPKTVNTEHYYEKLNVTPTTVRKDIKSPQVNSVMLMMGLSGPKNNDRKDTIAMQALSTALTGHKNARLVKALKSFNTSADTGVSVLSPDYNAPQIVELNANFSPGQEEEGLKTIYGVLQTMANQPISQQELGVVKNKMKNSVLSASESSMAVANMVGSSIVSNGDLKAYTNVEEDIDSLTAQDIQLAAKKYLNLNRASIVMVHPESQQIGAQSANKLSFQGNIEERNTDKFKIKYIKEYNLPNNLYVAINDNPNAIKTSANLKLKTDNVKSLKPGVADVLSLMMNKGTKNYTEEQLDYIKDANSIDIFAGADGRSISIASDSSKEKLPFAINVMKDMLYNPDLSQEKFEKSKEEIKLIYSSSPKDPGDRALEILYPNDLWGETPRKVLEQIDNVTLADVKALHQQLVAGSQGTMAIDGPISSTPGLGQSVFTELQTGMAFNKPVHANMPVESKPLEKNIVIAEAENRDQADIDMVFKINESGNIKDRAALLLLNEVLGGNSTSRLFMDLRESQKLAYRVKSNYHTDGQHGVFGLTIKTTTEDDLKGPSYDNLKKSINGFKKHIDKLVTTPVSAKELETAKLEVKTDITNGLESSAGRANRIQGGFDSLYGAQYNNQLQDAIESLTAKDIQNAAKVYLAKPSVISLIASPDTIKNTKPYLASLGDLRTIEGR